MNGQRISHFDVIELIGRGGMGSVYRARDTRLERDVALKFVGGRTVRNDSARRRLLAEARAASRLDHPNICTVYDVDETPAGELFVAMAYCPGRSLARRLDDGPLPPDEVGAIATQIADGLAEAHTQGIVHRDIKPANVVLDEKGRVKIVDFGLASLAGAELDRESVASGTTAYMAPEQVRGEAFDARSDVWAFGVLIYQLLTGRTPFEADYEQAIRYRVLHDEPDALGIELPEEWRWLEDVVAHCLQKAPADRPASMGEVAEILRRARQPRLGTTRRTRERAAGALGHALVHSRVGRTTVVVAGTLLLVVVLLLSTSPSIPSEKYLAVLPIVSLGDSEEDQLLSDGLAVTLTNQLAQLAAYSDEAFWVVPHSEVRGQHLTSASMARRTLGATLVLEGTLVRTASGLRLNFELIDTRTLRTVRAMHVTIAPDQFGQLQDEVAARIAEMMRLQLADGSRAALRAGGTASAEALDPYIRARAYLDRYERKENLETAVVLLERAIEIDPGFGAAHAALGDAHWRLYVETRDELHVTLAQRHLDTALSIDENLAATHVAKARLFAGTGRTEQAIEAADRALALEPGNAEAHMAVGRMAARMGLLDRAESALLHAITLRPAYWGGYDELGIFYYANARYEEAIEQFRRIIVLTPDNARAYSHLGATYYHMDRPDEAVEAFERSLSLHPTAPTFANLGTAFHGMGRFDDAISAYQEALRIEDGEYRVWSYLATAFKDHGMEHESNESRREAIRRAERQLAVNPEDQWTLAELAGMLIDVGQATRARQIMQSIARTTVHDIEVMAILGANDADLGNYDSAIDWWCRALEAGYPRSHLHLPQESLPDDAVARLVACEPS